MPLPTSRKEAQAQKSIYYNTGKPCLRGHLSNRTASDGGCCACSAERRATPEFKASLKEYLKSDRGKEVKAGIMKRYHSTEAGQATQKRSHENNKETRRASIRRYKQSPEGRARMAARQKERYDTDPVFRLKMVLRSRLNAAIRSGKSASAVNDLGCSVSEFMAYFESHPNWNPEWTWLDCGVKFQVDHIKALGLFDLMDPDQLKSAVHFSNLQPLSVADHKVKTAQDICLILEQKKCAA